MGSKSTTKIRGITIKLGGDASGLEKALKDVNNEVKDTQKQLKDVERLLKLDPSNVELLRQKNVLLNRSIDETKSKLDILKEAEKKVQEQFKKGEISEDQYNALKREIVSTEIELECLEKQAKQTGDSINKISEKPISDLEKALKDLNIEVKDTQGQLKDVERLLKLNPGNVELLRQKNELLNGSIEETERKLEELQKAEKQVQEQFKKGEASKEQYNALKREIIETENKLGSLKTEASKTENVIKDIDERPIEEVADAARKAEKELEDAGKEASNFADYLKADVIVEGAKGIVSSMKDIAEETKEYQKIMGSLEVSSERAGYSAEETAETYKHLYGILADDQTAATTTANLQALGLEQDKLKQMTDATIGAWATYGDSIPIDGLSEAINETVKVGTVTGNLADVLNWAGVSEDEFNAKLEAAGNASERADLLLKQLADQGLVEAGNAWRENNAALVENNETQAEMQEQLAQLGELIMPIITDITKAGVELLTWFNSLDTDTKNLIITIIALVAAAGPVISAFTGVSGIINAITSGSIPSLTGGFSTLTGTILPAVGNAFSSIFGFIISNPVVLLIAAIVGLVALIATKGDEIQEILQKVDDFLQNIFAIDWKNIFGDELGGYLNAFMRFLKEIWDAGKQIFNGIIDFIRGVFTGNWERAWDGVVNIFSGIFNGLKAVAKAPINGIIKLVNGAIGGLNTLIKGANKIPGVNISTIGKVPYLAKGGVLSDGSAVVGEAGPELLTMRGNQAVVQPLTSNTKTTNLGGVNIVVYSSPGQDVQELAEILMEKLEEAYERKDAVYA